jgi:hypothetical protein
MERRRPAVVPALFVSQQVPWFALRATKVWLA